MRVLLVHNYYQQAGGEDCVFAAEARLLISHGHKVNLWCMDNNQLPKGLLGKLGTALSTSYSNKSRSAFSKVLSDFEPDVVHVHNFFPQISPSVYDACLLAGVPVIQTLHNYRLICPGALLMRHGKICESCITASPYQAVIHGCYRNSKLGSLVVANMVATHRKRATWQRKVNRFIALTEFAKTKFLEAGFPEERIVVKPNFVDDPLIYQPKAVDSASPYALFVGRLSEEKGIKTLLAAWPKVNKDALLKVAGSGPLDDLVGGNNISRLGRLESEEISRLMRNAAFLVFPSEWYEGFPMVLVEALAHGLPILASRLGSMAEIVEDGVNGLLFEPGNATELAEKAAWLLDNPQELARLSNNARSTYLSKYTPDKNYEEMLSIYQHAVG